MTTTTTYTSTNARTCMSCLRRVCLASCPDNSQSIDLGDALSFTGVINAIQEGPQSHAEARSHRTGAPLGAMVLIVVGALLAGIGIVFTHPVARFIHAFIQERS